MPVSLAILTFKYWTKYLKVSSFFIKALRSVNESSQLELYTYSSSSVGERFLKLKLVSASLLFISYSIILLIIRIRIISELPII